MRGLPSRQLLNALGVLRLPAGDAPRQPPINIPAGRAFISRARIARRADGATFVVFPRRDGPPQPPFGIARCQRLIYAALRTKARTTTPQVRNRTLRIGREVIAENPYIVAHRNAGVCVSDGHLGVACSTSLPVVTGGPIRSAGTSGIGSAWAYLVPDGVVAITAHYPAESQQAGYGRALPAASITATVVNNLAVWRAAHEPGESVPEPFAVEVRQRTHHPYGVPMTAVARNRCSLVV